MPALVCCLRELRRAQRPTEILAIVYFVTDCFFGAIISTWWKRRLHTLVDVATPESPAQPGLAQAMILRVRHQNLGKVDVLITHAVIRLFHGQLKQDRSDPVLKLNMPPAVGAEALGSPGPIEWPGVSYDGCVTPEMSVSDDVLIPNDMSAYSFSSGGSCGTGVVRAGGVLEQIFAVIYTEDNRAYVGAAAAFAFDDERVRIAARIEDRRFEQAPQQRKMQNRKLLTLLNLNRSRTRALNLRPVGPSHCRSMRRPTAPSPPASWSDRSPALNPHEVSRCISEAKVRIALHAETTAEVRPERA